MKTSTILNHALDSKKMTLSEITEQTGIMKCNIRKQLSNDNLRLPTLIKFASCFGMSLVLIDKNNKQYKIK